MANYRKGINECSQIRVNLCDENKLFVLAYRKELSEKAGRNFSVERTIQLIIRNERERRESENQ
jgi:hypothetical protein